MQTILVTGSNGQLGNELKVLADSYSSYNFLFVSKEELPVDDLKSLRKYFDAHDIQHCINCAAYTAVDKAESEKEKAFMVNGDAVGNLAGICKTYGATFIHISTDYVFDGTSVIAYKEDYPVNPVNTYGASKLKGEELALKNNPATIIIRTSWVYSFYGNNFVKTMLRLMREKESINVVSDQFGSPTYAADLAKAILEIISKSPVNYQLPAIFNYSNEGVINWFEFAVAIKELSGSKCIVNPIPTTNYPTPAKRPQYSVLNTAKIRQTFDIAIPFWKESLQKCLSLLGA